MLQKAITAFALLWVLFSPVVSMAEGILIIANQSSTALSLDRNDIKQIFLGQKTTWDDGTKIIFVVQDRTKAGDAFLSTYLQTNASQYDNYWKKQVFTGQGKAPYSFSSNYELVEFVSRTPGAIGYVSDTTDTGDAKVITVR